MIELTSMAYGRRVSITTDDEAALRCELPFWWRDEPLTDPPEHTRHASAEEAFTVVRDVELWVAEHARDVVFVHAGAVAVHGRVILLPGRSYAGKTTLVAALLRAGADYLSDEYAVLQSDGRVRAYPRPLSLRDPDGERVRTPATQFGAATVYGPLPVAMVVAARYESDGSAGLSEYGAAAAMLTLIDNTVSMQRAPEPALTALSALFDRGPLCLHGGRGDADQTAQALLRQLSRRSATDA